MTMKLKILGCSGGIGGKHLRTTSLLIDKDILIDAGTGVMDLSIAEMSVIDHVFISSSQLSNDVYDYGVPSTLTEAATSSTAYALGMLCPASTLAPYAQVNVAFNELKWGGQMPAGEPNRKASAHSMGGFSFLGVFNINPTVNNSEDRFNAMVLTDVPIVAARRLATAIDGSDGAAANLNRVRRSDNLTNFAPLWTASGETEAKRITVVIFFDRIPPV